VRPDPAPGTTAKKKPAARRQRDAAVVVCMKCKREIQGDELRDSVRLQNGQMHGTCHRRMCEEVEQSFTQARASGTHSDVTRHVCDLCGQWYEGGIYHVTLDHKRCCKDCARRIGVKIPDEEEQRP
jgi:hypothetical protein